MSSLDSHFTSLPPATSGATSEYGDQGGGQATSLDYFEKMNPFPYASNVLHVKQGGLWKNVPTYVGNCKICRAPAKDFVELAKCWWDHFHKFECLYYPCRRTFPTQEAAHAHYVRDHDPHNEPATIRCNHCGDVVESYEDLNVHEHRHIKELNNIYIFFNCDKCHDRYITAQNFIEHLARHKDVTIRHVEIDKSIPSLALPKDVLELRKEQERTFGSSSSSGAYQSTAAYATPTTGGHPYCTPATPAPSATPTAPYSSYADGPSLSSMEIGADGMYTIKSEPLSAPMGSVDDESDGGESEKKKGKRIKKLPGEKRKPELKLFLCVECGRLMSRKSAVRTHEDGLDIKCKKVYEADSPHGAKVKRFEDKDVGVAKEFFNKLNENKGSPAKWSKIVEEINNYIRGI